ncbi:phytoene desaturase family protein [Leucobacter celer]|uniref:phytoene desaturase family protein n=1 Tax=Leucobacter celer TaxID=668625 RepID=UPI0006A79294|nr:NAD(P)/FAD-dependent oxidoreductase [Leucobacter celer]
MTTYDALIIGAGNNGLAAGVHLAAKGWKVAIIESRDVAGGAVKAAELTLPGYRHDLYAMGLGQFAGSAFHKEYAAELAAHGLEFAETSHSYASVFPDGTHIGVSTNVEETLGQIAALSPADVEAWSALLKEFGEKIPFIGGVMASPMPSMIDALIGASILRKGGVSLLTDLGQLFLSSARDFLDKRFVDDRVKTTIAAWGAHADFAPEIAGGAVFSFLTGVSSHLQPMVIGRGGADSIIRSMQSLFLAKGGEILLGESVTEVLTDGKRATGVRLDNGAVLKASRAVISNAHPKLLVENLLPAGSGDEKFDVALEKFRPGPATMMVHLALDAPLAWSAGKDLSTYAYVHIAPSLDAMSRVYDDAIAGLLPEEPVLVVGQPTSFDPTRAPEGKHTLWVQVRFLPNTISDDAAGQITGTHWDDVKEQYADRVVDLIERYAPGTKDRILARAVLSPADLECDNANLIGGDSVSGSHHLDQFLLFRPAPGYSKYRTPIKRLYMIGAGTWPGAGANATSGYLLAKSLAK